MTPDAVNAAAEQAKAGRMDPGHASASRATEALRGDRLRETSRRLGEPAWLGHWRERAGEIYQATPLPIRADHLWRYTDPAVLEPEALSLADLDGDGPQSIGSSGDERRGPPEGPADLMARPAESVQNGSLSGAALVMNGRAVRLELPADLAEAGVVLMDLKKAARERPDLIVRLLGSLVGPDFGKFEALNAATFLGGVFLYVPRDRVIPKPIHLVELFSRPGFSASRLLVLVEDGAQLTLIHELAGDPGHAGHLSNVAELELGIGARLQFATIQTLSHQTKVQVTQRTRLARSASFVPVIASFGGSQTKVDTGAILQGENAESEMTGFVSAVGRQRFDHHTLVHHLGRHTRSNLDFKTVLKDKTRSAYTGLIRIESSASFSEAYQENRNLLLSDTCRADSIPELEIMTEEVQCKHGATAGPIDPEHLFYLMSRAIPEDEAVCTIVEGHFEPTLLRLPPALQERLRSLLRSRLR